MGFQIWIRCNKPKNKNNSDKKNFWTIYTDTDVLNEDDNLKQLFKVNPVVGRSFVTAINLLIYTKAFTVLNETRKLACYCGVALFEYSSGTRIRGKTKVHCTTVLYLAITQHQQQLPRYYDIGRHDLTGCGNVAD